MLFKTIIIRLGRRRGDPVLRVNFWQQRILVRYDVSYLDGHPLETIPEGMFQRKPGKPGVILYKRTWSKPYFLRPREPDEMWTEDRYFFLAEKLFKEQGIEKP